MNRLATGLRSPAGGQSPQIGALRRLITKVSRNRLSVLLLERAAPGKEVVREPYTTPTRAASSSPSTAARWSARS